MTKEIGIVVKNKIAKATGETVYVCGNSDFIIAFDFDDEWGAYDTKTARFVYNGKHQDKVFSGNQCPVPVISDTHSFKVGVFAGNLKTSTSAYVPAKKSILCGSGSPLAPSPDVYAQIMEMLNAALARIEALERGGIVKPDDETSAVLGVAVLDKMVLA